MRKELILSLLLSCTIISLYGNDEIKNIINQGPGVYKPKSNSQGELISFIAVGSGRIRSSLPKQLALQQARKDAAREARNETAKFFNASVKWGENAAQEMVCVVQGKSTGEEDGSGQSTESSKFVETSGEKSKACSEAALSGLRKIASGYDENGIYCEVWAWDYKTVKGIISASKAMGKAARASVNEAKAVEGARIQNPQEALAKASNDGDGSILDGVQNIKTDSNGNVTYLQVIGVEVISATATSAVAVDQIKKIAQQNAIKHFTEFVSGSKVSVVATASSSITVNVSGNSENSTAVDKNSETYKDNIQTLVHGLVLNDITVRDNQAIAIYSWGAAASASVGNSSMPATPDGWLRCIGFGTSRDLAVKAALTEGIQQIFGAKLASSTQSKQRFASFVQGNNQGHSEQSTASQESSTNTLTQTYGFVREYKIVVVENTSDGGQKAVVDALIVNPRGNGVRTVMVYPMTLSLDKLTSNFEVGPNKRLSGSEISLLAGKKFEKAFSAANKFIVLNQDDLSKVTSQQGMIVKDVNAGKLSPAELSKIGGLLSADYILVSELLDFRYSRKMGYDAKLKKFAPIYSFVAEANFRLVSVENGGNVFNQTFKVVLPSDLIKKALEQDEKADLLELIMQSFTSELNKVIPEK